MADRAADEGFSAQIDSAAGLPYSGSMLTWEDLSKELINGDGAAAHTKGIKERFKEFFDRQ